MVPASRRARALGGSPRNVKALRRPAPAAPGHPPSVRSRPVLGRASPYARSSQGIHVSLGLDARRVEIRGRRDVACRDHDHESEFASKLIKECRKGSRARPVICGVVIAD